MHKKKVKRTTSYDAPVLMEAEYTFSPRQIVLLRMYSVDTHATQLPMDQRPYALVPGVIRSISFDDPTGSATPIAHISIVNYWRGGEVSGYFDLHIVPHRYVYEEDVIGEQHTQLFKDDNSAEMLFYVEKIDGEYFKVFPFNDRHVEVSDTGSSEEPGGSPE